MSYILHLSLLTGLTGIYSAFCFRRYFIDKNAPVIMNKFDKIGNGTVSMKLKISPGKYSLINKKHLVRSRCKIMNIYTIKIQENNVKFQTINYTGSLGINRDIYQLGDEYRDTPYEYPSKHDNTMLYLGIFSGIITATGIIICIHAC